MNKCLAIIPARGGSKRIPYKSIKSFCGQPIIKYSIDVALNSGCFDEIMVSTDDEKIADLAKKFEAHVPFLRSEKNSNDFADLSDVMEEVLLKYKEQGKEFDFFCCILATSPFINKRYIQKSFELLLACNDAEAVVPVVQFDYPIQRALKIENNFVKMIWPENYKKRSQDLEPIFHDCGQFYWLKTRSFLEQKCFYLNRSLPFELPGEDVQDIDTPQDWLIAEFKYKFFKNLKKKKEVEKCSNL